MCRIVLVGDLMPTSDKWKRIIESAGGETSVVAKTSVTKELRNFLSAIDNEIEEEDDEDVSKRLAILPDGMKKNALVSLLLQHHFSCVPSRFVLFVFMN